MKPHEVWLEACAVAGMILLSLCLVAPPFVFMFVFQRMGWFGPPHEANAAAAGIGIFISACFRSRLVADSLACTAAARCLKKNLAGLLTSC